MKICLICRKRNIEHYGICTSCREFNDTMREKSCDMSGRWAVVTGGRIKIGYAVCLRLLRAGAYENQLLIENNNSPLLLSKPICTENSMISLGTLSDYGETGTDNSWVRKSENISAKEMLEVQLINVTAPFLLTNGLRSYMRNSSTLNRFIVNVSSVEGRFNTKQKLARHVHTNMAKASLNMMTHSISTDFAKDRIFVYSCDPGWVSNQFPPEYEISKNFTPYLTFDDGAARVLYPVVKNLNEEKIIDNGSFYKDYQVIDY